MEKKVRHYKKSNQLISRIEKDIHIEIGEESKHVVPQTSKGLIDKSNRQPLNFTNFSANKAAPQKETLTSILNFKHTAPQNPSIVSTANGKIEKIFFTIPSYAIPINEREKNVYWDAYTDLFLNLPEHTYFLVLIHESSKSFFERWISNARINPSRLEVGTIEDHLHFSVWAEDGYAITKDQNGQTWFTEPIKFPRYADGQMAARAANISSLKSYKTPLYYQGGNILIGDNFFFIGADYPRNSLQNIGNAISQPMDETPNDFIKSLYKEYLDHKKELFYVGTALPVPEQTATEFELNGEIWTNVLNRGNKEGTTQPLFHIDMFISLAGRNSEGKYQILVGSPKLAEEIVGSLKAHKRYAMQEIYDDIAENLAANPEFDVIRNPLPLVYVDDEVRKERLWYFATANNCLVENDGTQKTVWLPTYGHGSWAELKATDTANRRIWENLGYKVNMLVDFHPFASNLGAVHCISKYLERSTTNNENDVIS
ncbi:MAG: hypothetical protein AB8B65_16295 [Kordia sp.]|uniref:hypothetical protein n=1 Tax=Kordia sp. TaxID=1965332 RepID=UPI00385AED14